jgi:hypothetical protein
MEILILIFVAYCDAPEEILLTEEIGCGGYGFVRTLSRAEDMSYVSFGECLEQNERQPEIRCPTGLRPTGLWLVKFVAGGFVAGSYLAS